ncbi:hypothetical protein Tco_0219012 [Tanacetum coccineum]
MAAFESCPKHNMVAYLEKTKGNAQFHEIFWNSGVSQTVNNVSQIKATVSGKTVLISESSIRRDLLFNDDNGIHCLTVADIYENLPLMGAEGGLNLEELFVLCTNLSNRVLALETSKDAQAAEILKLKTSIKKMEKKCKPNILHNRTWLRSVSILSMKKKLGKMESISKQGRKNAKPGPTLDDSAFDNLDADLAHGRDYMDTEEAINEGRQSKETVELNVTHYTEVLEKGGNNEEPINAAGNIGVSTIVPEVSTVNISTASRTKVSIATLMTLPTTTSVFDNEDITLAETLVKMKDDKTKLKGVAIKEFDRPARSVLTLKPLPKIDPIDKGKGVLEEEPEPAKKLKKKLERERVAAEEATQVVLASEFDEIQARMNANTLLAERLQEAEREQFTIEQRAKFFHDSIVAQRKFLAVQRAVAIRSKPLTKTQLRNQMITFLKYVGRYTHNERLIEKMNKKAAGEDTSKKEKVLKEPDSTKMEVKQEEVEESTRKRPGTILKMKARKKARKQTHADSDALKKKKGSPRMKRMSKRKKTDSDLEEEEHLKTFLKIVPDEEGIVDYERFETTTPKGVDLVLWGDLRTMVHTLILEDGTKIYMLVERKYPLIKETLEKMMSLKLVAESASDGAYNLLRSIQNKELASPKQTALGKDFSNPLMVDSFPKTIWLSMHYVITMKHWLFQSKRLLVKKHQIRLWLVVCQKLQGQLSWCCCVAVLLRCCKDDKDWKLMNVKYYKVTKEFKFIKEKIKEYLCVWIHPPSDQEA